MELRQKSIEDKLVYEADDSFCYQIKTFGSELALDIAEMIEKNAPYLSEQNGYHQQVSGVIKDKNGTPTFFMLHYLKQIDEHPVWLQIFEIDVDAYLDSLLIKQTLTYENRT